MDKPEDSLGANASRPGIFTGMEAY